MKVDSQPLSGLGWILVFESRGAPNFFARLALAASVTLNSRRPFDAHPLRAVHQVIEGLRARVAEPLMPHVRQCALRSPTGVGVEFIASGEECGT